MERSVCRLYGRIREALPSMGAHPEEKKVFRVRFVRFDETGSGLSDEDLQTRDDERRDVLRKEETTSRQVSQTAEDETDDGDDDIDSPNSLEEPGGDDSSEGAREAPRKTPTIIVRVLVYQQLEKTQTITVRVLVYQQLEKPQMGKAPTVTVEAVSTILIYQM